MRGSARKPILRAPATIKTLCVNIDICQKYNNEPLLQWHFFKVSKRGINLKDELVDDRGSMMTSACDYNQSYTLGPKYSSAANVSSKCFKD